MNWRLRASSLALPVLAGLIALLAPSGRANAMGCHAPDRPTLGLSSGWERVALIEVGGDQVVVWSHQVRPTPCDREVPGETARRTPTAPAAPAVEGWVDVEVGLASLDGMRLVESDRVVTTPASLPLDRPPR